MGTWTKNKNGKVDIEFSVNDLVFSNVQNTKQMLSEVSEFSLFYLITKNIQEFDSSGLQLLIYFVGMIKKKGGQVEFDKISPDIASLCSAYGIDDLSIVERITNSLSVAGGSDV